ncbi:hypothetical protein MAMC_02102 [Methylacidimicrobium cyclopophantes]|uniref:Uncharacterized protein n=1 Tax=Methylacidimicrobium cyclopophantes TaxID=1041766 RepID=A0A5E6MGG9_9BACT|nr:hypothetical protein [Methylacidimicrobium cyclopophantes]VVM08392.1 hypothetical protein MAMC_02102 [Methylacidimicrobium cyclopophantes]
MSRLADSDFQSAALARLESSGCQVSHASEITLGEFGAEGSAYREAILEGRLRDGPASHYGRN